MKLIIFIRKATRITLHEITSNLENQNSIMMTNEKRKKGSKPINQPAHKAVSDVCLDQECSWIQKAFASVNLHSAPK